MFDNQGEQEEKFDWYILKPGSSSPEGPFSIREIDVKFRTNEISSQIYAWREGQDAWKKIHEIDELKEKLIESKNEIIDNVAHDILKKIHGTEGQNQKEGKEQSSTVQKKEQGSSDFHYYCEEEKAYKVFDPVEKKWHIQQEEPTEEQLNLLRTRSEEVVKDQKLAHEIHKELVGEENEKSNSKQEIEELEQQIVTHATQDLLDTVHQEKEEGPKTLTAEEIKQKELKKLKKKRNLENKRKKWYAAKMNTFIYIQGLPEDITHDELKEYFVRCGVIRLDPNTGKEQIRIYTDDDGRQKGDARIGFAKIESVETAVEMLNDTEIRQGVRISVQQAEFEQKGEYVPRKKAKVDKIDQLRIQKEQERQFAWEEDQLHEMGLKIVVLEGIYTPQEVEEAGEKVDYFFEELEIELSQEITSQIGPIHKMEFFKNNPKGIVKVKFHSALHAEECLKMMNGRFFDGRELNCYFWDGKEDFRIVKESAEEQQQRINDFGDWLLTQTEPVDQE